MHRRWLLPLAVVAVVLIAAAGMTAWLVASDDEPPSTTDGVLEVAVTDRALSAAIVEAVDAEPTAAERPTEADDAIAGATVRFDTGVDTSLPLEVTALVQEQRVRPCSDPDRIVSGCYVSESGVQISWQDEVEDEPGSVVVSQRRDGFSVLVFAYGPRVRGDPARSDRLGIEFGDLVDLVTDRRLAPRTTEGLVEAGEASDLW